MNSIEKIINETIDSVLEYQIILNSLKWELEDGSLPKLYRRMNNGPSNINRNFSQFLSEHNIRGVSKAFISISAL